MEYLCDRIRLSGWSVDQSIHSGHLKTAWSVDMCHDELCVLIFSRGTTDTFHELNVSAVSETAPNEDDLTFHALQNDGSADDFAPFYSICHPRLSAGTGSCRRCLYLTSNWIVQQSESA